MTLHIKRTFVQASVWSLIWLPVATLIIVEATMLFNYIMLTKAMFDGNWAVTFAMNYIIPALLMGLGLAVLSLLLGKLVDLVSNTPTAIFVSSFVAGSASFFVYFHYWFVHFLPAPWMWFAVIPAILQGLFTYLLLRYFVNKPINKFI